MENNTIDKKILTRKIKKFKCPFCGKYHRPRPEHNTLSNFFVYCDHESCMFLFLYFDEKLTCLTDVFSYYISVFPYYIRSEYLKIDDEIVFSSLHNEIQFTMPPKELSYIPLSLSYCNCECDAENCYLYRLHSKKVRIPIIFDDDVNGNNDTINDNIKKSQNSKN